MAQNSIGTFEFIALIGGVARPRQTLEISERPGTDDATITWTGVKGRPFQLHSQVDAASYNHARTLYEQYIDLIDAEPVDVVQGGLHGGLHQVLEVEILRIGVLAAAAGQRIHPPSGGWIECLWTLYPKL